ncbi:MAG: hypothetical protein SVY53_02335 [Chloroflexota bacterium]|nr:hypothetical protein [Chloroflexota bacterium]
MIHNNTSIRMSIRNSIIKVGLLGLILLVCITATGTASARWADSASVEGMVQTGDIDWSFVECSFTSKDIGPDWICDDGFTSIRQIACLNNQGETTGILNDTDGDGDRDTLVVDLHKRPCEDWSNDYYNEMSVTLTNNGTIPIKLQNPVLNWQSNTISVPTGVVLTLLQPECNNPWIEFRWNSKSGVQLEPNETMTLTFEIRMLQKQDCQFEISIDAVPWNRYQGDGLVLPKDTVQAELMGMGKCKIGKYLEEDIWILIGDLEMEVSQDLVRYSYLRGWCVDLDHWIDIGDKWDATMISSIEKSQEWNKINYIINYYEPCTRTEAAAIQLAIWYFVPHYGTGDSADIDVFLNDFCILFDFSGAKDLARSIIQDANENGQDFIPGGIYPWAAAIVKPADQSDCGPQQVFVEWDP